MSELFFDDVRDRKVLTIENANLRFLNFSGRPTSINPEGGVRQFCVDLPDEKTAKDMKKDGWNVKEYKNADGDIEVYYIPVEVRFENFPPTIKIFSPDGTSINFTEENVGELDNINFEEIGISINPYYWEQAGNSGIKAYLGQMNALIIPNRLDENWDKKFD